MKTTFYITSLIIFFVLYSSIVFSQEASMDLPTYHPVSPNAASLGNFGLYPVNKNLGKVAVNIPIYNLSVKNLNVPINLSYNTSGIRLNDLASWVGLGWTLNAGGAIIRNTKGLPDIAYDRTIRDLEDAEFNEDNFYYLRDAAKQLEDTAPDQYVINALGISGSFYYDQDEDFNAVFEDASMAIKINPVSNDEIHAILEDGTTLIFGTGSDNSDATELTDSNLGYYALNFISTWYLTEVISSDRKNTISFRYKDIGMSKEYARAESEQAILYGSRPATDLKVNSGYVLARMERKYLDQIIFNNGYIKFESTLDREDLTGDYKLDAIKVYFVDNRANEKLIDEYHFTFDYYERSGGNFSEGYTTSNNFTNEQQRKSREKSLKLISMYRGTASGTVQKHQFVYNGTTLPLRCTTAQDYWGYCNTNSGTLLQKTGVYTQHNYDQTYHVVGNGNRNSDEAKMKAGVLEKIIYPTRGYTIFEHEANRTSSDLVGGLRIKSISNYDGKSVVPTSMKTFKYENTNLIHPIGNKRYIRKYVDDNKQSLNVYVSTSPYYNNNLGGEPVIEYGKVAEYDYDYLNEEYNGKTISYYENVLSTQVLNGAVTLNLFKHDSITITGTVLNIMVTSMLSGIDAMNYYETTTWKRGKLKKEETYKSDGSDFVMIKYVENDYETIESDTLYNNYVSSTFQTPYEFWTVPNPYDTTAGDYSSVVYCYHVDKTIVGRKILKQTIIETYDSNGQIPVTSTTDYFYDNPKHVQLTRTKTTDSNGETLISKTIYPDDVASTSRLPGGNFTSLEMYAIDLLKSDNQHRIAQPIQIELYRDYNGDGITDSNELLSIQRTIFKDWDGNGTILPERKALLHGVESLTNQLEDRIIFYNYDSDGNPVEVSKADDSHSSYVWGYNKQYPVVIAENSDNVTLEDAVSTAVNSLSGYSNGLEDLDALLSDISEINTEVKRDTWLSFNTNLRSQSGMSQVKVNSFTHDPLIGITSQTDPAGITTYFEYDNFGRLESVKDHNEDIVKAYDYHYILAPELTLSTSLINPPLASGSTNVPVNSNTNWTVSVSDNDDWITVSPTSGNGNGTISISYTQNAGGARTGTVTVSGADIPDQTVTINQAAAAPTLALSPNSVSVSGNDMFDVYLTSNTDWKIIYIQYYSGTNWIEASAGSYSGFGNTTLHFIVDGNSGDTGEIIIETLDGSITKTIYVSLY